MAMTTSAAYARVAVGVRSPAELGAAEAAAAIREGGLTSEELVEACLARIAQIEDRINAWAFLDPEHARQQAKAADAARARGRPVGALHGVPVGVKDIIDTADMPTEDGTPLHAGRRPRRDATVVALLRAAGAVILGKTVTTEFATYSPGKTRNPHDPERSPGGSSSGSAAAVASGMAPLALGTQTNGSVIRPASYCGVVGYKPTHGLISRSGVLRLSRVLDHVGVFARTVPDAALIAQELMSFDAGDPDTRPLARPRLADAVAGPLPFPPRFAFVRTPAWDRATADTQAAFAELAEALGEQVREVTLAEPFADGLELHRLIMESDLALNLAPDYEQGAGQLSSRLREMIERGARQLAVDYNRAVARIGIYNAALDDVFHEAHAIITPAATGEAPRGLGGTGDPAFCTLWTLCGLPAVTVPVMQGPEGLPLGVQLVGPRGDDARLLQCAQWLVEHLAGDAAGATQ
jgi:Asp-tRNA(Asn)/Glu-tRNA(Gln) amidotransferase A subunit family amidase